MQIALTGRAVIIRIVTDTITIYRHVTEKLMESATLSVEETAKVLGIGRNSAYEGVRTGEIPSIRIGKRILVPRLALERILENAGGQPH